MKIKKNNSMKQFLIRMLIALLIWTSMPNILPSVPVSITASAKASSKKPKLDTKQKALLIGQSCQINVLNTKKKAKWQTSNKKVATVSKGVITAKAAGKATITAKVAGKKLKCKVTVNEIPPTTVEQNGMKCSVIVKDGMNLVIYLQNNTGDDIYLGSPTKDTLFTTVNGVYTNPECADRTMVNNIWNPNTKKFEMLDLFNYDPNRGSGFTPRKIKNGEEIRLEGIFAEENEVIEELIIQNIFHGEKFEKVTHLVVELKTDLK